MVDHVNNEKDGKQSVSYFADKIGNFIPIRSNDGNLSVYARFSELYRIYLVFSIVYVVYIYIHIYIYLNIYIYIHR